MNDPYDVLQHSRCEVSELRVHFNIQLLSFEGIQHSVQIDGTMYFSNFIDKEITQQVSRLAERALIGRSVFVTQNICFILWPASFISMQ